MKLKHLLLIAALIIFSLTACAKQEPAEQDTTPTLPTFAAHRTPWELLNEAMDNTKAAASCTVQYGTVTKTGDEGSKDLHSQKVTSAHPFDLDILYRDVPDFPTNKNLLSDFCALPLRAIPSNDGTFRYELSALSWEDLWALMHGPSAPDPAYDAFSQAQCTAAIDVDDHNRVSRLEFTAALDGTGEQPARSLSFFLSIEQFH